MNHGPNLRHAQYRVRKAVLLLEASVGYESRFGGGSSTVLLPSLHISHCLSRWHPDSGVRPGIDSQPSLKASSKSFSNAHAVALSAVWRSLWKCSIQQRSKYIPQANSSHYHGLGFQVCSLQAEKPLYVSFIMVSCYKSALAIWSRIIL